MGNRRNQRQYSLGCRLPSEHTGSRVLPPPPALGLLHPVSRCHPLSMRLQMQIPPYPTFWDGFEDDRSAVKRALETKMCFNIIDSHTTDSIDSVKFVLNPTNKLQMEPISPSMKICPLLRAPRCPASLDNIGSDLIVLKVPTNCN